MNSKKLIGTIIGVTAFAALVAGATFAWLTYSITTTNDNYSGTTRNFLINYTKGTDISSVPILSGITTTNLTGTNSLSVTAAKSNSNDANGTIDIFINTVTEGSATTLDLTSGLLKYAVSIGGEAPTEIGTVSSTSQIKIVNADIINSTTAKTYTVYFWIDASLVDTDDIGQKYSGYISATAVQTES